MKKKILSILLILIMLLSISLTGCGDKNEKTDSKIYDYDLAEYVKVGEYKGIEVENIEVEVTSEEINAEIERRLQSKQTFETVLEGTVAMGDKINIDYLGTMDGEAFSGGSTNGAGTDIIVGQAGYIEGFEAGLVGLNVGDSVVLDLRFPDPYHNPDLAGKECQFEVTINNKQIAHIPTYDIEFVKANTEFKSLAEYEQSIYEELLEVEEADAQYTKENAAWAKILTNAEVLKYPEKEVEAVKTSYSEYLDAIIMYQNYTKEQYLEIIGMNEEEYEADLLNYAQEIVKNEMVLYSIARSEGIEITSEEYDQGKLEMLEAQGFASEEEFMAQYGQKYEDAMSKDGIITSLLLKEVMAFILENATIVEPTE